MASDFEDPKRNSHGWPHLDVPIEEQYHLLVDAVADYAIFLLDSGGHIRTWNAGAQHITGYTGDEVMGKHFAVLHPEDAIARGSPGEDLNRAASRGHWESEDWRLRKDGSRYWVNVVITAMRRERGKLVGFAVIARDLTEHRHHEEQLQQSEERFRLMVETVQDYAIFMLDPSGHVTSWNTGAQRIKGYSPDEIIGRHFSKFYTAEDIAIGKPLRELAIASSEGRIEDEGWRVRRDGSRFWANVTITAVRDASSNLLGFAKVTRDMTERVRLSELEHAIELAAQLQSTRENEQRRIAQELHDDLGQQLTALKMSVALMEPSLRTTDDAQRILSATQDLEQQIDTMTASVRRIAAGLRPPMLDDLGLLATLDWLTDDFTRRYGVHVISRFKTGDLEFTEFAATAVFRMVQEALTNVARHAQASEVVIQMTRADCMCTVRIEDNGVGCALDAPHKDKSFGLQGMRQRVRQLSGSVSIDSAPGRGFRIAIQLPESAIVSVASG